MIAHPASYDESVTLAERVSDYTFDAAAEAISNADAFLRTLAEIRDLPEIE